MTERQRRAPADQPAVRRTRRPSRPAAAGNGSGPTADAPTTSPDAGTTTAHGAHANGVRPAARPSPNGRGRVGPAAVPATSTVDSDRTGAANGRRRATVDPSPEMVAVDTGPDVWEERVADLLAFLRRRITGAYEVDEFGFDHELTDTVYYPFLRLLYRHYFRVEVFGVENLPRDGSALVVANHSGALPADALMLSVAIHDEMPVHRHLRLLAADLVLRVPLLSELARKGGSTMACNPDAERLLRAGEFVGVFPEGYKGLGKHYRDRYKLQRFGRGGFVSAALRTGAPIVPVSIVGAEEIYPIVGSIAPLAKALNVPYLPVTPLFPWFGPLGAVPLPSKWLIEFGEPIPTVGHAEDADDPIVVFNLADQVRETIQHSLYALLERRPDPFG